MPLPDPLITSTAERLGGTPVFAETRVPVQALLDYLEGGDSLEDFPERATASDPRWLKVQGTVSRHTAPADSPPELEFTGRLVETKKP